MLKREKGELFTKYFTDNIERAKTLFSLPLNETIVIINSDGIVFTEDELRKYAEYFRKTISIAPEELNELDILGITGGSFAKNSMKSVFSLKCLLY